MKDPISIRSLMIAIRRLPPDPEIDNPKVWYRTQKEHWLGWLSVYDSPGAYGRKVTAGRDARFAYNHIVCPQMLIYLSEAAGVDRRKVSAAKRATSRGTTLMQSAGEIRAIIPWETVAAALWKTYVVQRSPVTPHSR